METQNNDRMLEESNKQDHNEAMRIYSLVHNGLLLVVVAVLMLSFENGFWFTILLLILWDWSYKSE